MDIFPTLSAMGYFEIFIHTCICTSYYLRLGHTQAEGGLHVPAVTAGLHRIVTGAGAGAIGTEEVVDGSGWAEQ